MADTIDRDSYQNETDKYLYGVRNAGESVSRTIQEAQQVASDVLVLSQRYIWIARGGRSTTEVSNDGQQLPSVEPVRVESQVIDRFDYDRLWSLKLGDYFLPMSQTFTLRAKKTLNTSNIVDGPMIIQQTRKEAKTVDVTLRISLTPEQAALQILDATQIETMSTAVTPNRRGDSVEAVADLARVLQDLYESDAVFAVRNATLNDTLGVQWAIMSEYRFEPRPGANTYTISFALTEVLYDDNVVTFDLREVADATQTE